MRAVFGDAFFHFPAATWFAADLFDVSDVAGAIFGSVFEAQFLDSGDKARQFWQRDTGFARFFDLIQVGSAAVADICR